MDANTGYDVYKGEVHDSMTFQNREYTAKTLRKQSKDFPTVRYAWI